MKKIYFLAMALLFTALSYGQVYLFEDFSANQMPPEGWSIDALSSQWSVSASSNAGGTAPEAKFSYIYGTHTSRLISPIVDLSGNPNAQISFKHFYDYVSPGVTIGVATRFDFGAWNIAWQTDPNTSVGPKTEFIDLTGVGQSSFQFCFFITGNLYNVQHWFIDDIKLFVPMELDAELSSVITPKYHLVNTAFNLKGVVVNQASTPINSFDVSYTVNGGAAELYSASGLNLALGEDYTFTHTTPVTIPEIGACTIVTTLSNINGGQDMNPDNNMLESLVTGIPFIPNKKIMAEVSTGTWAGWGPKALCFMDYMSDTYPDTWIGIAVHNGSEMTVPEYDGVIYDIIPGYGIVPSVTTDRTPGDMDPSELEAAYNRRMNAISPATLEIINYSWNPETREVTFDLQSEFVADINTELRFGVIFIEDSLHGTSDEWAQYNLYADGSNGPMCGFENLPDPVPAEQMHYDHVARAIIDTPFGTPASLPQVITTGSVITYNYAYTLPETWRYNKLNIIGFLVDMGTKEILNANNVISSFVGVNAPGFEKSVAVYPNPFGEYTNVTFNLDNASKAGIEVMDIMGKTVYIINERKFAAGLNNIRVASDNLPNGMYILKLTIGNQTITRKISVIK